MLQARLDAQQIVVEREGRRLLDGASLRVGAGEIAAVQGPSGSGKTTLLKAMATLTPLDGGRLLLDGVDALTLPPTAFRRRVAYVPQQPPMLDGTVADNLATGPRLRGEALSGAAAHALLERVGLPASFGARPARALSGGERHRVALARALANQPVALLLDEPTAALDPVAAGRVLDLARELGREGLSIIVVTHSEEHAARLGGARYVCAAGKVTPRETTP